jgi:cytochrome c peroxidase
MKQVIYFLLVVGAGVFTFSCTQEFNNNEIKDQKVAKLRTDDLGKYKYESVNLPYKELANAASMLLVDNQGSNSIGNSGSSSFNSFNMKGGEAIKILNVTNAKADLGRVLFYDQKLSLNNAVSCGSCHFQKLAFADGKAVSEGFEGRITSRNAMAIVNPAMSFTGLFWDNRANCVKKLVLQPVQNHIEMGMEDLPLLAKKLAAVDYYPDLFMKAYGSPTITEDKIAEGLNAFIRSFVTWNSKYDEGMKNSFANFTTEEHRGKILFSDWNGANCGSCHNEPTFDRQWGGNANIGLDKVSKDKGDGSERFKVPSLRNIELTGPYMHDGRFKTLEEVIDHYSDNVQFNSNLDWNLQDNSGNFGSSGKARKLNLSPSDKKALVAFLKTLTDKDFTTNPKFSDPFTY